MKKVFKVIDRIPLVQSLQVLAALMFLFGLIHLLPVIWVSLTTGMVSFLTIFTKLLQVATLVFNILIQPLVLLALAEIIKLLKTKTKN